MAEESPLGMGWNTAKHKQVPTMAIKMKPCKEKIKQYCSNISEKNKNKRDEK
jgi:hypothetical protein